MSKRSELQRKFDDKLDSSFGHLRFSRYGRCAVSLPSLATSGVQLVACEAIIPSDFMDASEASVALEREQQIEQHLTDVLDLPTMSPATGYGLSLLYSRWRQRRLTQQMGTTSEPHRVIGIFNS